MSFRVYYTFYYVLLLRLSSIWFLPSHSIFHPFCRVLSLFICLHFSTHFFFLVLLFLAPVHPLFHFTIWLDMFFFPSSRLFVSFARYYVHSIHAKKIVVVYIKFFGPKWNATQSASPSLSCCHSSHPLFLSRCRSVCFDFIHGNWFIGIDFDVQYLY